MIFIIRALSQVRKGWWRLWFPHKSGWDFGLYKKKKKEEKRERPKRKKREKGEKEKRNKMREKERKDNCYYLLSTHVLQNSTMIFMIESLICCQFHILVGIFHYRTWLVYSNDGLPQNALGLCEQASWMHTQLVSFVELSYIYSSSASVAWQSLLTHIDIYWWASP